MTKKHKRDRRVRVDALRRTGDSGEGGAAMTAFLRAVTWPLTMLVLFALAVPAFEGCGHTELSPPLTERAVVRFVVPASADAPEAVVLRCARGNVVVAARSLSFLPAVGQPIVIEYRERWWIDRHGRRTFIAFDILDAVPMEPEPAAVPRSEGGYLAEAAW